jgi:hypothetical protein
MCRAIGATVDSPKVFDFGIFGMNLDTDLATSTMVLQVPGVVAEHERSHYSPNMPKKPDPDWGEGGARLTRGTRAGGIADTAEASTRVLDASELVVVGALVESFIANGISALGRQ